MKIETTATPIRLYADSIPFNSSLWIVIRQLSSKLPFSAFQNLKIKWLLNTWHMYTQAQKSKQKRSLDLTYISNISILFLFRFVES